MVLYFKAKIDVLKMLPVMLKKRRCIMKARRISNKDRKFPLTIKAYFVRCFQK